MNLIPRFRDAPVKHKLMFIAFLSAAAALLFAMVILAVQQWVTARAEMVFNISNHAKIISTNSTAALLFGDQKVAAQTMDALASMDEIEFAVIYDKEGQTFASFVRPGMALLTTYKIPAGKLYYFSARHLDLFHPIVFDGEQIGTIYMHVTLVPLYTKIVWGMTVLLAAMLGGLGVAWMLISRLHPIITQPISELIGLIGQVSREKNYALRVMSRGNDELGVLGEEFNEMLAQIQSRDDVLAQRTAKLTEAQRIAHIGDWEWDIVNNTLSWSDEIYRIFGLMPQQFGATYEAFLRSVHPDDRQFVDERVREALEQACHNSIDHRILLPDGAVRYVQEQIETIRSEDGQAISAMGTVQDITEIKLAEKQLRKQQELTVQIIETIPMRVFWKDRALRYLGCNTAFARDAGEKGPDDLIGKDDLQLSWREQADIYRADDRLVMEFNTSKLSYDEPQTTPTGERIWIRSSKVPLHNVTGEVIGVLGTYEDITERKNMEITLQQSEERFRLAFQNSAIGMALVGVDGRWLMVNDALCRILGYAKQELLRKTFQDITHPDDLESDLDFVAQLRAGKIDHYQMEKRYLHRDGHVVWVLLSVSLVSDAQGKPIHFVSQIDDITEDKQVKEKIRKLNEELETRVQERTKQLLDAQEELVRKEKLSVLGLVAGSVGHELRNPLGVMSNAVYFLQVVLSDADETTREYLGIIKSEIAASERIVSDLLDSVRTKPPYPEMVGVAQLIEQSLGKCTIPPSVEIKLDIPTNLPPLRVDSMQIHQVFRNLISNGVEAMPEGGTLEIRAVGNEVAKNVTISVRDTGIGMTPEQLSNLFQPLFTTKARGIGLGLVVVKNLIQANSGNIEVQSETGKGTVFSINFPYGMENVV